MSTLTDHEGRPKVADNDSIGYCYSFCHAGTVHVTLFDAQTSSTFVKANITSPAKKSSPILTNCFLPLPPEKGNSTAMSPLIPRYVRGVGEPCFQWAISELLFASGSRRALVLNHSNDNEFDLHENPFEWLDTRTHFELEENSNSEMG